MQCFCRRKTSHYDSHYDLEQGFSKRQMGGKFILRNVLYTSASGLAQINIDAACDLHSKFNLRRTTHASEAVHFVRLFFSKLCRPEYV